MCGIFVIKFVKRKVYIGVIRADEVYRLFVPKKYYHFSRYPRGNTLWPEPPNDRISLEVWPPEAENGGTVTVHWSGVPGPHPSDHIAYYCPYNDFAHHHLDLVYGKNLKGW